MTVHSIQGEQFSEVGLTPTIPLFEGNEVSSTRANVRSTSGLDIADRVFKVDSIVRMVVEARVDGIAHDVDRDGKLVRIHRMKVVDSIVIDWSQDLEALRDGLK